MQVHILQHVPFEGLGCLEPWLKTHKAQLTYTYFFEPHWQLPKLDQYDLLIILGGPMSVNDEADWPWLVAEKAWIAEALAADKAVLGICLGAQLMASALGAAVYPGPHKEIGWFPLYGIPVSEGAFAFPVETKVFHWHGETFDLPVGAIHLARSAGCAHQAFQWGTRALGLQFHLETTPASAQAMLSHCADELQHEAGKPFVQSAAAIEHAAADQYLSIHALMEHILLWLLR